MQECLVYLFTGFLESGKTTLIQETLNDPGFNTGEEKTLILLCEEGGVRYTKDLAQRVHADIVSVNAPEKLTAAFMEKCEQLFHPDRVMIEFNGMWEVGPFLEGKLPPEWPLYQIVTTVNAETFELYSNNIGPRMFEHISLADLIVFNRCTDALKQMLYQKNIRAMNPRATIFLDDVNGGSEDYRDNMPRPFDMDAPVIEIADEDFGLWYVDATGSPEQYAGKTVKFKGMVYKSKKMEQAHVFVPGRFAMVCCAEDVQFVGFLCKNANTAAFPHKSWVTVTAEVRIEYVPQYRGEGPVLYCKALEKAEPPKEELVYFN